MNTLSLTCQKCGAPLAVAEGVRFLTCNYCHSRLEIVRDESSTHTRLLENLERRSAEIVENLEVIKLQNQLERLDREWLLQRDGLMVRDKEGNLREPNAGAGIVGGVIAVIFGIFWTSVAGSMGAPFPFPMFGLVFIAFALYTVLSNSGKASAYKMARVNYERRRLELLRHLSDAEAQALSPPTHLESNEQS
ncbi:MAG TPA: hypothetical protein VGK40_12465 [Verrucomicrobiae bacterium]|jgi:hypothetical protein